MADTVFVAARVCSIDDIHRKEAVKSKMAQQKQEQTRTGVRRGRPHMPKGYGVPEDDQGLLDWTHVQERMTAARHYWICTSRPDGRPHATPIWGVWVDDVLYIEGAPETRRGRNIAANPAVSAHLESGEDVLILEGEAHEIVQPDKTLAARLVEAYGEKYAYAGYRPTPQNWDSGGLYAIQPRVVIAWTKFPQDATRWMLDERQ